MVHGKVGIQTDRQQLVLQPDEQYVYQSETHRGTVRQVDATQYISWKEGILNFDKMPLDELARKLSRWYDVHIFYLNPAVKKLHFTAWFRRNSSLEEVIDILKKTQKINVELKGKTVTVREF